MGDKTAKGAATENLNTSQGPSRLAHDPGRREFVTRAATLAATAGATLGFPIIATPAQPITLQFQTTWLVGDPFYGFARDYGRMVEEMTGGRLRLSVLPAAAVAGTLSMQEAVNSGAIDGGLGVAAYWYEKSKAYSLFGTPPAFGWDANTMLGWVKHGGGQTLYAELQKTLKLNIIGFLAGPMPSQPLGWFKKPVRSLSDLKNLRYRTSGLAADLMRQLGVKAVNMPGADIVPAMKRGALDAAEFSNPSSDLALGLPEVAKYYMLRSYHQPAECFEIIFNKARYERLPRELQLVLRHAAEAYSSDTAWTAMDLFSRDLQTLETQWGVRILETPAPILRAQLDAWDKVIANLSRDPFAARVIESQKAWNKRVVGFQIRNDPPEKTAYDHFFET